MSTPPPLTNDVATDDPQALRCTRHPRVETYLRCGRCETPICPRCLIQTPVGARCRTCARVSSLPTYDVPWRFLLRGAAAALGVAALGGAGFLLLPRLLTSGFFFPMLIGGLGGMVVARAVSAATNYKRGASLGWATVATIFLGFCLGRVGFALFALGTVPALGSPSLGRVLELGFNPGLPGVLLMGTAALVAYYRLR